MRKCLVWVGAILLVGCAKTSTELLPTLQPGGGPAIVFQKPVEIVFPAAVRVVNLSGEPISEARMETGRLVFGSQRSAQAVFFQRLPNGRTRVELSPSLGGGLLAGGGGFFTALREEIVDYEKKDVIERERRRETEKLEKTTGFGDKPPPPPPTR